ncbi:MAG TPA: glycosyltransferase family 9 protein, partial [Longimicrobiaceae bacterium]
AEMHPVARAVRAGARYGIAGDFSNLPEAESRRAEGIYDGLLRLGPERYGDHDFAVTRDFLRMLGIDASADELRPEFWTDAADRAWAEGAVPRAEGALTLGIAPGVTAPRGKFYPLEQLARAVEMAGDARLRVVLFGSASEAGICAELGRLLDGSPAVASITDLSGRSTLRQMVEGIRRCDAFLAPDAAALHVAVALGKPTVGILGGGHYGRFHPWGDPERNRICSVPMECYGCNWTCRFATTRCVLEVTPEQVAGALRDVLALAGRGAALHTPA